ncbi:MAG TPA: GNAT family N-acetyltransferase [Solirubrobacteraceae bacterium]|nr:GNAT family N-acetyltransferase [Solirubrobacteraceae bacterium]
MSYEVSLDARRVDREWVWRMLSGEAYWLRWRTRADVEAQLDGAWRVAGAYAADTGSQVGFARAFSDGVAHAYLSDVIVDPGHRGRGVGKLLVGAMVDDPVGARLQWMLHTTDAHGLYAQFGFEPPDERVMVRPAPPR